MVNYVIGADPELFLIDGDGKYKSAHNVIPGSKNDPMPVLSGAIQPDGVAAEFNIHPAATAEAFSSHIKDVLGELQQRIEANGRGLRLIVTPTAHFEKSYFRNLPKKAKLLGCEPDFNVWNEGRPNASPSTKLPMRTGAGHIHIGWTEYENVNDGAHLYDVHEAVKQLDASLYFVSLLWDSDDQRRSLYGRIGAFRPKHYGVEYRPLSNAWVADPDLHVWLFNATMHSMHELDGGIRLTNDYWAKSMIDRAVVGDKFNRTELLEYYDYLVDYYGLPALPEAYSRVLN